nr:MAG TPA: nucleoid-associated protein [Caudoviricetes sp.]
MNILGYTTYQDINLDWVIQKIIELEQKINSGGGGGTTDHTQLINRNAADQHPMSAITGLPAALAGKQPAGNYVTGAQLNGAVDDALAEAKASGEFDGPQGPAGPAGDTGPQGPAGADGYSPSAKVEQTSTGATITITDKTGTTTATVNNGTSGGAAAWEKIADISTGEVEQVVIPLTKQYAQICGYIDATIDTPDTYYIKLDETNIISNPNWWANSGEQRMIFVLTDVGYGVLALANGQALTTSTLNAGEAIDAYISVHVGALTPANLTVTFGLFTYGATGAIWGVAK